MTSFNKAVLFSEELSSIARRKIITVRKHSVETGHCRNPYGKCSKVLNLSGRYEEKARILTSKYFAMSKESVFNLNSKDSFLILFQQQSQVTVVHGTADLILPLFLSSLRV